MTRQVVLSDDALRRALTPDVRGAPSELLASIAEEVARTRQRPSVLAWRPWMQGAARGRGTWVLVAAAAMLVLLAGLLLATGGRPQPIPRSPLVLPPLVMDIQYDVEFLAVGLEDAWVADPDGRLWHGTAAGWTGPELSPKPGVRALVLLSDGRLVVADDYGLRIRQLDGDWSVLSYGGARAIAIDSDGTIWAPEGRAIGRYSEQEGGWNWTQTDCPAGGFFVAAATDGTVWTGGFAYAGTAGLARFDGTRCERVKVLDQLTHDVYGLAAGPDGQIVAHVGPLGVDPPQPGDWTDPRIVLWDGSTWRTLSVGSDPLVEEIAIGSDGQVYAAGDQQIRRFSDGRWETVVEPVIFSELPDFGRSLLATAPDGTLWYATWRSDQSLSVERVPTADQPD